MKLRTLATLGAVILAGGCATPQYHFNLGIYIPASEDATVTYRTFYEHNKPVRKDVLIKSQIGDGRIRQITIDPKSRDFYEEIISPKGSLILPRDATGKLEPPQKEFGIIER